MRRDVAASILLFAVGLVLLTHFACLWCFDRFYIFEDSKIILSLETLIVAGITAFGVERLWHVKRKRDKGGSNAMS